MQTIGEAGYPGLEDGVWYGLSGPPGIPRPIVDRLERLHGVGVPNQRVQLERPWSERFGIFVPRDRRARIIGRTDPRVGTRVRPRVRDGVGLRRAQNILSPDDVESP